MGSIKLQETNDFTSEVLSLQWMEYAFTHLHNLSPSIQDVILMELNDALTFHSYFGGNQICLADKIVFGFIKPIMEDLTFQEKEKFLNLSRWFNTLQNDEKLSDLVGLILFSRSLLYK